jgi:hypothetical protein
MNPKPDLKYLKPSFLSLTIYSMVRIEATARSDHRKNAGPVKEFEDPSASSAI